MDKQPVGQLPDLTQSNNDDEIMVITNSEYNQLKKEKISDLITDFTSTNENNALTKGTDGKLFVTDFGNASNITEGTLPVSVLPDIPKDKLPEIETDDLPDSGITAGTYTYPTDIVVNSKGQVTSITEGQPGANNANQDLSNLSLLGLDKINQSKALETGSVSSDADVYADVLKYKNSGTGTGIDTIKPDEYTVVGSPTITSDGVASGLTASNYLTIPKEVINSLIGHKWRIDYKVKKPSTDSTATARKVFGNANYQLNQGNVQPINLGRFNTMYNWFASLILSDGTHTTPFYNQMSAPVLGDMVGYLEFDGTKYTNAIYDNNEWKTSSFNSTLSIKEATEDLYLGYNYEDSSIDLNSIKIYVDGNLVYQPCLKIPYTLSKTGSKIVDAAYRDRVQDMYEQYGYAPYYTIDEENENFTLPMGEIYGMIEKKADFLNNPYTLFDSKYSETLLYNASWLLSNGTYYSKSVYVTAYEALVVENNTEIDAGTSVQLPSGTTYVKRGLSVKLSTTEDITDYDFVINTTDETFRLPLKTKGAPLTAETVPVISNGYGLGLVASSGVHYLIDSGNGAGNILSGTEAKTPMLTGSAYSTSSSSSLNNGQVVGVSTNAAYSGLIADFTGINPEGLYLYFYVGDTIQNANLINAGKFAEQLSNKANSDLSNCTKPYVTETYKNGTSWYRLWSDGWCEQGGYNSNTGTYTVTMMKEFADTNYTLLTQYAETTSGTNAVTPNELSTWNKTTSSFTTYSDFAGKIWLAFGYVA